MRITPTSITTMKSDSSFAAGPPRRLELSSTVTLSSAAAPSADEGVVAAADNDDIGAQHQEFGMKSGTGKTHLAISIARNFICGGPVPLIQRRRFRQSTRGRGARGKPRPHR